MERETGFEPATACLEGRNSTAELLPLTPKYTNSGPNRQLSQATVGHPLMVYPRELTSIPRPGGVS